MRHNNSKHILNRPADQRKALKRNLLTSLFLYGKVRTTEAKAKALSSEVEKLITTVKRQKEEFNAIRELKRVLFTENACRSALEYIKKTPKTSGFSRRVKVGYRDGDGALLVHVELITDANA